jgi:hypothetical protein
MLCDVEYVRLQAACLAMAEQSDMPHARDRWVKLARACSTLRTTERRAELDGRARARRGLRKPRAGLTVTLQLSPLLSSHTHLDGLLFPVWPHVDMSHARYIAR